LIFSSKEYLMFFLIVLIFMMVVKSNPIKKGFLLLSSYYFYAFWDYRFVVLMFLMSFANYYIGLKIQFHSDHTVRKRWLIASVALNLTVLGFFKYFNFFIDSANGLLNQFDVRFSLLEIILPIGISFITFEAMSYTMDIYRKENRSAKSFWDLALLIAFFPHLIAGPILKPKEFLPQFEKEITIRWVNVQQGIQIFIFGLAKKVLVADRLALFVDPVFKNPQEFDSLTIWLAVIAYATQIYCDFSGYSDMAIGSAKCLGFDIPRNFHIPYVSRNITEFWRRWHISLSTWLKEYLYISLGGNRRGKFRQYMNLMIVMLLGGLWHGASWNFVVWGGLHGIGLAVHKIYKDHFVKRREKEPYIYRLISWLITMLFVCTAWVFFRSSDFSVSLLMINKMYVYSDGINWIATSLLIALPLVVISHFIGNQLNRYLYFRLDTFKGAFVFLFVLFGFLFLLPSHSSPFIYFQF
jgi:alginate O-acetyltransferase complex protein AlgI